MSAMASKITSITNVYSSVYSGADQRKYQSSASLAFVRGIHRSPVNSPHKGPVSRIIVPFDDAIMYTGHITKIMRIPHGTQVLAGECRNDITHNMKYRTISILLGAVGLQDVALKYILDLQKLHSQFIYHLLFGKTLCTERGGDSALLCTKYQNHCATKMNDTNEWDYPKLEFKICFSN